MPQYVFIDESGDLGKFGSKYFTIVAVVTQNPVFLSRAIKKARMKKLKKKMRQLPEIKANNSDEKIRKFILRQICSCKCDVFAIAISKTKVREDLFGHKEKLYNYLCGLLLGNITIAAGTLEITIDKKGSNKLIREDFNQYISSQITRRSPKTLPVIKHLESHSSGELQAVDFIAWAVNRKFSHGDSAYYDIIRGIIKNSGKEETWK